MFPCVSTSVCHIDERHQCNLSAGIVFVGGFSYADVLESAKGWAGTIRFSASLQQQFQAFYSRPDTFSLGVCNGCQLMALLGWVPGTGQDQNGMLPDAVQPRFIHNRSDRCGAQMPNYSCAKQLHACVACWTLCIVTHWCFDQRRGGRNLLTEARRHSRDACKPKRLIALQV